MEETNKTFEFHYEIKDQILIVRGIITSFTCPDEINLDNVDLENYKEAIFNVSLISEPLTYLEIFDLEYPLLYIVGFDGRDGQLGYVKNNQFVPVNDNDKLVRTVNTNILEVLSMDGYSGHFINH